MCRTETHKVSNTAHMDICTMRKRRTGRIGEPGVTLRREKHPFQRCPHSHALERVRSTTWDDGSHALWSAQPEKKNGVGHSHALERVRSTSWDDGSHALCSVQLEKERRSSTAAARVWGTRQQQLSQRGEEGGSVQPRRSATQEGRVRAPEETTGEGGKGLAEGMRMGARAWVDRN